MTCAEACDGECCVGTTGSPDACEGFTGRVCKDNYSCNGESACTDADIDLVVGGCRGDYACYIANITKGVIRGCIGLGSCFQAGYGEGYVGQIKDGCVGEVACEFLGINGNVGHVDNACVGQYACYSVGENGGNVGHIKNACKGYAACGGAGRGGDGYVGFIESSCIGKYKQLFLALCCLSCSSPPSNTND